MNITLLLQVLQGLTLVSAEIIPAEQLIAKLHSIFTLNPNVQVSIQNLAADALQADADTIQLVKDWQAAHGISSDTPPAPRTNLPTGIDPTRPSAPVIKSKADAPSAED
jgi:hypothetical protein